MARLYSRLAPCYAIWSRLSESRAHARAIEAAHLTGSESVLEVAIGAGELLERICGALTSGCAVGIDLSVGMIWRTRRRLVRRQNHEGALCLANAVALPFAAAKFDVLFNCFMLDLLSEEAIPLTLAEFRRVLKPEGRLVLLTMARQAKLFNAVWMRLYRWSRLLVAGCRPVTTAAFLEAAGWCVERREEISQVGFRAELFVACPGRGQ